MLNKRRKILFYTHALTGGGAERVIAVLASGLALRGHDVTLAVDFVAMENRHMVDPSVRIVTLGESHVLSVLRLAWLLFREKPEAALSALSISNIKLFLAALFTGNLSRSILGYHGYSVSEPQFISRISYALTPLMSRMAAATVCVSDGLRQYVIDKWRGAPSRLHRIYNPVSTGPAMANAMEPQRENLVLASGRMVDYKNFVSLVRAFAKVEPRDARLVILGQGPEHKSIQKEIDRQGLGDRVMLAGYVDEPWVWYRRARCFALSSTSESFGLVIVEAMANGVPIVSTDCDGPREILQGGRLGRLAPIGDDDALAAAITATLTEEPDASALRRRARDFSLDAGLDNYGDLIAQVINRAEGAKAAPPAVAPVPVSNRERRP